MDIRQALSEGTFLDASYRIVRVVGVGGFGITYEAHDENLDTPVAIKEYFPHDYGGRENNTSVHPRSEWARQPFEWGRTNFLKEARTLAGFEHPSIVRVLRVFEANSTAYMVMRFEHGMSLEKWLRGLGRAPTQEELDYLVAPLLDALQILHAADYLHRDIAPDNVIVRPDGTPVLLDFGSARRVVAEMSRSLTGIVKAGYSPHEQYSVDSRRQGPWTDIYALGGTLYRAVSGMPPHESTLRFDQDYMPSAADVGKGSYRPEFLKAIDDCLKVRPSERPQSVAELRPRLVPRREVTGARRPPLTLLMTQKMTQVMESVTRSVRLPTLPQLPRPSVPAVPPHALLAGAVAALALSGGLLGFSLLNKGSSDPGARTTASVAKSGSADPRTQEIERPEARPEDDRRMITILDNMRRRDEEERQKQEAERKAAEEKRERDRIEKDERERKEKAAAEEQRRKAEQVRLQSRPSAEEERAYMMQAATLLKKHKCFEGLSEEVAGDAQKAIARLEQGLVRIGRAKFPHLELAKATVAEFDTWLKEAETLKGEVCVAPPPHRPPVAQPRAAPRPAGPRAPGSITGIQ